jgi:protocatechuate 3,4-dioxygenase beta subunit
MQITRRQFAYLFLGGGLVALVYPLRGSSSFAGGTQPPDRFHPTPSATLGPYYRAGAPRREKLTDTTEPGVPLVVTGRVFDTSGKPIPAAQLEVFHANDQGEYDMSGFRCRGDIPISASGDYRYETIMPAAYGGRAQHVHYRVTTPGGSLITQLYFETDPKFGGNPDQNYSRIVGHRELIRPVTKLNRGGRQQNAVTFDICLPLA